MGIWATIVAIFNDEEEQMDYCEYEIRQIRRIIRRFEGFSGVYVIDADGNTLDPDNLPNPNASDGGADWIIHIEPNDYTDLGFKRMKTQVENILRNM
jgi:hypothetical protein